MLDILEIHLKAAASPELCDAVTKACEWFEDYELPGYQDEYTNLLLTADNADAGDVNAQINELTLDLQSRIFEQLSLFVSIEITVQQGNTILEALRSVERTEFSDEIVALCTSEEEVDNALCEILGLVSGQAPEYFYPLIENVDRSLLDRIKMICQQDNPNDTVSVVDPQAVRRLIDRLIRFRALADVKPLFIYDLIIAGQLLELPFAQYFRELWEDIAPVSPQMKAVQLFAASLISSDGQDNPRGVIAEELGKTYTSADEITPIITALETVILKFHADENAGVKRV